jgi:SAM-dependent methyltransferase
VLAAEAAYYVEHLLRAVRIAPDARVLDFGCGFGLAAAVLAPAVGEIQLWDVAPAIRRRAAATTAFVANAHVLDDGVAEGGFDVILVNSVVQYMSAGERRRWLRCWRAWLAPAGIVVLSDVPRAGVMRGRLAEAVEIVVFHARRGRLGMLCRERLGDLLAYRRAARACPLAAIEPDRLRREAADAGFEVRLLGESLTCRRRRLAAVLRAA